MLTSKTHEIINIPRFMDPCEAFSELVDQGSLSYLDESISTLRFIQRIGYEWRTKLNYAWLVSCGFIPFSECVKKTCLPTIDGYNCGEYVWDDTIYRCPLYPTGDVIFDSELNPECPNCGEIHKKSELIRLQDLWADFPLFAGLHEFSENFSYFMFEATKLQYEHTLLISTETRTMQ